MIQEIQKRKAKSNYQEGLLFGQLFNQITEGFFSKMLGEEAFDIIAEAYEKPNNEYSYENVTFAMQGENICGMFSAYSFEKKDQFQKNLLQHSTKGKKGNIRRFHFVSSILMGAMGAKREGEYYLQAIIVKDEYRGMGLGKKMMGWVESEAKEIGADKLVLDVSSKNKTAIGLYQRQNLTIESQWPRLPIFPSVFTRMSKAL